jgi:hypothetical protein
LSAAVRVRRPHDCSPYAHKIDVVNACRRSLVAAKSCTGYGGLRPLRRTMQLGGRRCRCGVTAVGTRVRGSDVRGMECRKACDGGGRAASVAAAWHVCRTAQGAQRGPGCQKNEVGLYRQISARAFGWCKNFENRVTRRLLSCKNVNLGFTRPAPI